MTIFQYSLRRRSSNLHFRLQSSGIRFEDDLLVFTSGDDLPGNSNSAFEVPFRYRRMRFTAVRCVVFGSA